MPQSILHCCTKIKGEKKTPKQNKKPILPPHPSHQEKKKKKKPKQQQLKALKLLVLSVILLQINTGPVSMNPTALPLKCSIGIAAFPSGETGGQF